MEKDAKGIVTEKPACPKHYRRWTYKSTASFFTLEKDEGAVADNRSIYSRIHVYYGDFAYYQHEEKSETTAYLAFCNFANLVMLYWGISVIGFFHIFYYLSRYL